MNSRALAYFVTHSVVLPIDGEAQPTLPLDKLQGFLDLLTPDDVPPEALQRLYRYQAEAVQHIQVQFPGAAPLKGYQLNAEDDHG